MSLLDRHHRRGVYCQEATAATTVVLEIPTPAKINGNDVIVAHDAENSVINLSKKTDAPQRASEALDKITTYRVQDRLIVDGTLHKRLERYGLAKR